MVVVVVLCFVLGLEKQVELVLRWPLRPERAHVMHHPLRGSECEEPAPSDLPLEEWVVYGRGLVPGSLSLHAGVETSRPRILMALRRSPS